MKLLGRKRAKALAAGTVPPDEVFIDAGDSAPPAVDVPDPTPASGGEIVAPSGPITAPVPVVEGPVSTGEPPPPKLRFGFGEGDELPPPTSGSRPAMSPGGTSTSATVSAATPATPAAESGSGEGRRVVTIGFGDDLEELETTPFDPSPVDLARPEMDPRLRARRIGIRRGAGRRRLRWAIVGGVVAAVLVGTGLVLQSPLFAVNDVEVTGAEYTDPARLQEVVDQLDGATLLGADLGKAEAALAADPWIKRVRVERRPLRGVRIEIVERVPVATYMGLDQRWRVVDAEGRVMAVLDPPGSKPVDPLELALAAPGPDLDAGATVPASLAGAASIVPRLPPDLRSRTCSLGVDEQGRLRLTMCDGFVVELGSPDRLRDKLVSTIFVMNTRPDEIAASSGLDVGDPERPVLIQK